MSRFLFLLFTIATLITKPAHSRETEENKLPTALLPRTRLASLEVGSIFVYSSNDRVWLVAIKENRQERYSLVVSEATQDTLKREGLANWFDWYDEGSFSSLSTTEIEIDATSHEFQEKNLGEKQIEEDSTLSYFLKTLFSNKVKVKLLFDSQRRKIGPTPLPGEIDVRKVWQPPLPLIHGKTFTPDKKAYKIDAFEIEWPQDGSDFEGKSAVAYYYSPLTKEIDNTSHFLSCLPIWLESKGKTLFIFRLIDCRKGLSTN